jgi:hypothetical protein
MTAIDNAREGDGVAENASCPLCSSCDVAAYVDGEPRTEHRVVCHACGCSSGYYATSALARAAWNRRPDAMQAQQGAEPVAWRYRREFGLGTHSWTNWLNMDELRHYGPDGNLIAGPHPDWTVEYAYPATGAPR